MEPKKFKALQDKWYKKLKQSGFDDIEYGDGHENLKVDPVSDNVMWGARKHKEMMGYDEYDSVNKYNAKVEYFRLAGIFLLEYQFESKKDQLIWQYHCEGKTMPEIVKLLDKKKVYVVRTTVNMIVLRLAEVMLAFDKEKNHE